MQRCGMAGLLVFGVSPLPVALAQIEIGGCLDQAAVGQFVPNENLNHLVLRPRLIPLDRQVDPGAQSLTGLDESCHFRSIQFIVRNALGRPRGARIYHADDHSAGNWNRLALFIGRLDDQQKSIIARSHRGLQIDPQ